jgi:uncharacterized membrane protein YdbT with pleckstrin-like domain
MVDQDQEEDQNDTPNTGKQHTKYFADQFDDEEVLYVFRKHPIVMRRGIVWWAVGMLAGPLYVLTLTILYKNDPDKFPTTGMFFVYMLGSVVLSLILLAPSFISWYFSIFIVTDQRFIQITQKGLFHRSVADVGLEHIQSVNYEVAGLQATMLGFGTMKVQTYIGDILIHELHHPAKIQKRIIGILRDQEIVNMQHAVQVAQASHKVINEED